MKIVEGVLVGWGALVVIAAVSALLALFVMLLWNWLCPVLFELPEIGLLQAWGLSVLCNLLFKRIAFVKEGD